MSSQALQPMKVPKKEHRNRNRTHIVPHTAIIVLVVPNFIRCGRNLTCGRHSLRASKTAKTQVPICVEVVKKTHLSNSAYILYAVNKSLIELHSLVNEVQ